VGLSRLVEKVTNANNNLNVLYNLQNYGDIEKELTIL